MGYNNRMFMFYAISTIVIFIITLLVAAVRPEHSHLSLYELERRIKNGDRQAKRELSREKMLGSVVSLQKIAVAILQVASFTFAELALGMVFGMLVALALAFGCEVISHRKLLADISNKIYASIEPAVLRFIRKTPRLFKLISGTPKLNDYYNLRIDSREELQHLVANSDSALSADEKKLIVHSLSFNDRPVSSVMTPRSKIVGIKKDEFIGPLLLDDLCKVGHSWLPVMDENLDNILGILNIKELMSLDSKKSMTAEKAMQSKVYYIRCDQTLHYALVALLHTHHHMLIVVNDSKETVGILTLEDIIESLLGREVTDEFTEHGNINAVISQKK